VLEAVDSGSGQIEIWGDGRQTRSFMYIDDCLTGIDRITHCQRLTATPINLGSSELVSINRLVELVEAVAGVKLERRYKPDAPLGVAGRNSDNTFIKEVLGWEPSFPLAQGIERTYRWIQQQYRERKAGQRTVS
jgi:nucleoside-diphosphate-sugar epimerase